MHEIPYPNILGSSFAGTVVATGDATSGFVPGDRVSTIRIGRTQGDPRLGGYPVATAMSTAKLDAATPLADAAAVIINLASVVSTLNLHLGLARPPLDGPAPPRRG